MKDWWQFWLYVTSHYLQAKKIVKELDDDRLNFKSFIVPREQAYWSINWLHQQIMDSDVVSDLKHIITELCWISLKCVAQRMLTENGNHEFDSIWLHMVNCGVSDKEVADNSKTVWLTVRGNVIECRMMWAVEAFEEKNGKSKEMGVNAFGEVQQGNI